MQKNTKIILNYPNYQHIVTQYLNLEEFKQKATETMRSKRVTVTAFCNYLGDNGIESIDLCQQKHVADFMENISVLSTSTKSGKAFILRHFFNYLHSLNLIPYSGNELFPVIMTNKRDRILSFYSEDEIKKLISHVDNRTISGKRDFLIVLLAAELGMRSGDICRLNMSDIHWERDTIEFTQFKTGVFNQLPLLDNVKFAIIDYLRSSRPSCSSTLLFVGLKNDFGMISASQIHSIVSKYFKKAGIDISKRKHGPHALRHSLASSLLSNNTPMHVIKDVLGHTNLNTTKIYLNIDFNTLKHFALEVPNED
ncbi:MAG: site-specific integrase [Blautia sp.]|nr:site-specific integrase [Blautia sp.]